MRQFLFLLSMNIVYAQIPALSFIALDKDTWKIVVCKNKKTCITIPTEQEPRTYDYDFETGNIIYIASDNSVRTILNHKEIEILKNKNDAYTQPSFIDNGKHIMLVQLIHRRSKKTRIIRADLEGRNQKILILQASTDLHPSSTNGDDIYYTKTLCTEGCLNPKQEIWYKNVSMGNVEQLTLRNSISDQLSIDKENKILYFTSLSNHSYHIWQYQIQDATLKQLTFGDVIDSYPSPYKEGVLFLRQIKGKTKIMKLNQNKEIKTLHFIPKYTKIRNLKVKK